MNGIRMPVDTMDLTLECLPPLIFDHRDCERVHDYTKWIGKCKYENQLGWKIKEHENCCTGCGSLFCFYQKDPESLNMIIDKLVCIDAKPERKRFIAYQAAIRSIYRGRLGKGVRKQVRYCFEIDIVLKISSKQPFRARTLST